MMANAVDPKFTRTDAETALIQKAIEEQTAAIVAAIRGDA